MKVLFITNVPSPYRVDFFNELGKYCDLTVVFEKKASNERDASWRNYTFKTFKGIFLKGISISTDSAFCFGLNKIIKNGHFDKIICTNFSSLTGMRSILYMRRKKISYFLESDGGFEKSGIGLRERIKKYFIRGAEGYFSTSDVHDQYYLKYGAEKKKIYRYPFTSLLKKDIIVDSLDNKERAALRRLLGMNESKIILTVGQFIHRKGFDLLLRASVGLPQDVGVYFVGGVPTDEYLQMKEKLGLRNVHFEGFKLKEELKKYYQAADLFVLPTREDIWGLVVNEAMANGLPVITTDKCVAGIELVQNERNGFIVRSEDYLALQEALLKTLSDNNACSFMGKESLSIIKEYTIEKMSERHLKVLGGAYE